MQITNHNKAEVAILISEKLDCRTDTKDKEGHFTIIIESVYEEHIIILNMCN